MQNLNVCNNEKLVILNGDFERERILQAPGFEPRSSDPGLLHCKS